MPKTGVGWGWGRIRAARGCSLGTVAAKFFEIFQEGFAFHANNPVPHSSQITYAPIRGCDFTG
jgi:hypothetical protein